MSRATSYLLLACFLHLQIACCCAAHARLFADGADAEGRADSSSTAHGHDEPSHADHGHRHSPAGPCDHEPAGGHDCHLCVIAHLHYVPTASMPPLDLMAIGVTGASFLSEVRLIATPQVAAKHGTARQPDSLLSAGSLLRV